MTAHAPRILRAGLERAAEFAAIHRQAFEDPWDEAAMAALLAHDGARAFVGEIGERREAAGFVLGRVAVEEAEILTLAVSPGERRRGFGRALVAALVLSLARDGAARLFLEVAASNAAARALYGGMGFAEAGRRKGYYQRANGRPEDALILAFPLDREVSSEEWLRIGQAVRRRP